jgi:hypothetical protein
MSKDSSSIALSTGSPFAVVVMFFGYGFVGASSFSRMPVIRDQLAVLRLSLRSHWSAWELAQSSECPLRGGLWTGIPHEQLA